MAFGLDSGRTHPCATHNEVVIIDKYINRYTKVINTDVFRYKDNRHRYINRYTNIIDTDLQMWT